MPRPQSIFIGNRFNRLLVRSRSTTRLRYWVCECDCGTIKEVFCSHLINNKITSCGCYHKEVISKVMTTRQTTHGMVGTPIYGVWNSMNGRCFNPSCRAYKNYGARGITVCNRWRKFENFLLDMGDQPPGMTLERINNNRGYSKSNCTWATMSTQANNKRTCVLLTYKKKTQNITQWANELGIPRNLIYGRIRRGWGTVNALSIKELK